jgi:allophanate hydrolase|uniref:Putative GCCT-like superfamily protein n=1 Tax=Rhodococcus sp. Mel TaxID=1093626 RepID=H8ZKT6_9NOCA|nr:putative GCCT-like superfamily protein [Rhodococcus sp. Mel]
MTEHAPATASSELDTTIAEKISLAYARMAELDRPEIWITLREESDVLAEATDRARTFVAARSQPPLFGTLVAVKDNIDVAGLPTTCGCPAFGYTPATTAHAVQRLIDQGAIVLGKTNLDQFATGLVGTRSPYGAVRCAWDLDKVSGGSSSGSAVAVALGIVDIALGTDTAGSGRVPAAFNNIVGIKPSRGLVSTHGVTPACIDYDVVTVFAGDLPTATQALEHMVAPDPADSRSRTWPADVKTAPHHNQRVAVPRAQDLSALSDDYRVAFAHTVSELTERGTTCDSIDISPLLNAAELLYDGAIVAQRYNAVGAFLENTTESTDATVKQIILAGAEHSATSYASDQSTLVDLKATMLELLDGYDALLLPTTTDHPAIAAVQADPLTINRRLGTYTNFANLLDMTAVSVPGHSTAAGDPFGVTFLAPAFDDQVVLDIAALLTKTEPVTLVAGGVDLFVVGAHLRGFPAHHQLDARNARFLGEVSTTDAYRLVDLHAYPPRPGLIRMGQGDGSPVVGELYRLAPAHLGTFLAQLPTNMGLGHIELSDGRWVTGFCCTQEASDQGTDITEFGGWRAYRAQLSQAAI